MNLHARTNSFCTRNQWSSAISKVRNRSRFSEALSALSGLVRLLALGLTTAKGSPMGLLDPITSLFGGGGSSAAVSSSVNSTVKIEGLDKISVELKPVELKPVTLNENIDIKPIELKPVTLNQNIDLKPVTLNENVHLDPVTLNESIDLKPVAVDTCQTLRLAPLPDTSVCNPYTHRIAVGLLGFEIATVAFTGETEQQIRSPQKSMRTNRSRHEDQHTSRQPRVVGRQRGISIRVVEE
jgi:hypothetical protein